jgi:hypothetical protein
MGSGNSKSKGVVLPNGLPVNWPYPSDADMKAFPNRNIVVNGPQGYFFATNYIITSKYTTWNFLPKFLAQSFHPRKKMANVYFFIIACMQMVSEGGALTSLIALLTPPPYSLPCRFP